MLVLVAALGAGLGAGYLLGGRLENIRYLSLRAAWLVLAALALQLFIFWPLPPGPPLDGGPALIALHLASYGLLLLFVAFNARNPGVSLVGVGLVTNTLAIVLNGGYMPATRRALEFAGLPIDVVHNNSELAGPGTHLRVFCDTMSTPSWFPLTNVFSVGDVLVATGVAVLLATAMRLSAPRATAGPS